MHNWDRKFSFLQYQNYFLHSNSNAMLHYKILKKRPPENTKLFPTFSKLFPTLKINCYETNTLLDGTHSVTSKQKVVCPRQTILGYYVDAHVKRNWATLPRRHAKYM